MKKVILISILFATIALPTRAANDPSAARGLKKAVLYALVFQTLYWLSLLYIYPRLD